MPQPPDPSEIVDITGPEGATLFWHAKEWLVVNKQEQLQRALDDTWTHYQNIEDERLLALVAALCVEEAVQSALVAFGPGFGTLEDDADFSYSMKIKVARALQILPARIFTACDLVRSIRNAFAHNLELKRFTDLDNKKYLVKLEPTVRAFNSSKRDPSDYAKLFRELAGFILMALQVYSYQVSALRSWLTTPESREPFAAWVRRQNQAPG